MRRAVSLASVLCCMSGLQEQGCAHHPPWGRRDPNLAAQTPSGRWLWAGQRGRGCTAGLRASLRHSQPRCRAAPGVTGCTVCQEMQFCIALTLCSPECLYKPSATSFCPAGGFTRTGKDYPSAVSGSTLLPSCSPSLHHLAKPSCRGGEQHLGHQRGGAQLAAALKSKASAEEGLEHSSVLTPPAHPGRQSDSASCSCTVLRTGDKSFHKPAHKNRQFSVQACRL